jgi:hypothetical protein
MRHRQLHNREEDDPWSPIPFTHITPVDHDDMLLFKVVYGEDFS